MRVFVAGASGAIGTRLVPQLIDAGHEVIGTYRSPGSAERLRALGRGAGRARPARRAGRAQGRAREPSPTRSSTRRPRWRTSRFSAQLRQAFAQTNRLRTEGTDALLAAAREAGVRRFVAQSFASIPLRARGRAGQDRGRPARPRPRRRATRESNAAMRHLDEAVTDAGGIALRYGGFYGADNDGLVEPVRKRQFPIVGDGGGVMSFIHLDDAAAATVLALEHDGPAIYNIVDDEPAPVRDWLPVLADALGAKPPRHVPGWLARLVAGEGAVMMGTESRGASNAKAKRELGWTLRYPSWRGFSRPTRRPPNRSAAAAAGARDEPRSNRPLNGRGLPAALSGAAGSDRRRRVLPAMSLAGKPTLKSTPPWSPLSRRSSPAQRRSIGPAAGRLRSRCIELKPSAPAREHSCGAPGPAFVGFTGKVPGADVSKAAEKAILAGGCFWGMQELLRALPGVLRTRVGYSGGLTRPTETRKASPRQ